MPSVAKRIRFGSCIFNVYEEVYEPAEDSFLFAENLEATGEQILDLGAGCGLLGILAAKKSQQRACS